MGFRGGNTGVGVGGNPRGCASGSGFDFGVASARLDFVTTDLLFSFRRLSIVLGLLGALPGGAAELESTDYARMLPFIPPMEPEKALASFRLADERLRIELVASEPLLRDPVAIDFDERGRLYVVEFPEYNQRYAPGGVREGEHGRVRLLEDTDGDGRMDRGTDFADGLDYASAIFCWDGGVFVGVAPDILYLKDTDGDGKADHREVVLTGFAREEHRAGQAPLNSFRWGLDQRIYLNTNFSGGAIRPGDNPDAIPLKIRNRDLRFDPRTRALEATSGGGQHGMSFDDWGRRFVCRNSEPSKLIYYDDRYLSGNPWLAAPAAAVEIAVEGKYTPLYSISPDEPWRKVRTRMRAEKQFGGPVEGPAGTAQVSGYFTAATGVTVYRGDALPEEYRGNLFTGEAANNLVYRAKLEPDGVALSARRARPERNQEFLASTDNWFRPVQMAVGPDGALYVVDMYRFLIEGAKFLPPEVLAHLDLRAGADRGRIYRITAGRAEPGRQKPDLGSRSIGELVGLLDHANGWHRDTASRLLAERHDPKAISALRKLSRDERATPLGRTHARYALRGQQAWEVEDAIDALAGEQPEALRHGLILAESFAGEVPALSDRIVDLSMHEDATVRYQALWSLGSVAGGEKKREALAGRLAAEGEDLWMRLATFSAIRPGDAGPILANLLTRDGVSEAILEPVIEHIARSGNIEEARMASRSLADLSVQAPALADELARVFLTRLDPSLRDQLIGAGDVFLNHSLKRILDNAGRSFADPDRSPAGRAAAIGLLRLEGPDAFLKRVPDWLQPGQPPVVHEAVIDALSEWKDAEMSSPLIEAWPALGPGTRARALDTLLARPAWALRCLEAVRDGTIGRGELGPARTALLRASASSEVRRIATEVLEEEGRAGDRAAVVDAYRAALDREGDGDRGRAVFRRACVACHRLENVGNAIGASLAGIGESGADSVLLNILDPNRDVKPDYLVYTVETRDGQAHSGMIRSESANSLVLRRLDGSDREVLRKDVTAMRGLGISFMPDGLEAQISIGEMADLLAYLEEVE